MYIKNYAFQGQINKLYFIDLMSETEKIKMEREKIQKELALLKSEPSRRESPPSKKDAAPKDALFGGLPCPVPLRGAGSQQEPSSKKERKEISMKLKPGGNKVLVSSKWEVEEEDDELDEVNAAMDSVRKVVDSHDKQKV